MSYRGTAWKAQVRLCARYHRLIAKNKPKVLVTAAIAREMIGVIWANACRGASAYVGSPWFFAFHGHGARGYSLRIKGPGAIAAKPGSG